MRSTLSDSTDNGHTLVWTLDDLTDGSGRVAYAQAHDARLTTIPTGSPIHLSVPGLTDAVLSRHGSRFRRADVRAAIATMVHHGHEVILPPVIVDPESTGRELLESCFELCRLALRFPDRVTMAPLALDASTHPDPWVRVALSASLLDPELHYTATLGTLRDRWLEHYATLEPHTEAHRTGEILLRWADDAPRRLLFEMLEQSWLRTAADWPCPPVDKPSAMAITESHLGETGKWLKAFRQHTYQAVRRLVLIPTWQCELRCSYCFIPKQDGREMSLETIERGVEMLLATERDEVWLQFFGGEALIEYARVQHAITYSHQRAAEVGKKISYVISSNGWTLDKAKLDWLKQYPVRLELSLDGDQRTQERYRASRWKNESSYEYSIATHAKDILASGIEQYVIMVVHPTNVDAMPANFFHLVDLGFRHIQINNMLGRIWKPHEMESWAKGLFEIGRELQRRWAAGEEVEFINMRHRPLAMRLNGEVTIDHDGTIYGGNAFLHETEHKDLFRVAHLDDCTHIDRYWVDATDNNFLLDWSYRAKITDNNLKVGQVMASFCKWLRSQGYGATGPEPAPEAAPASP